MVVGGVDELPSFDIGGCAAHAVGVVAFAKVGLEPREVDALCCA